MMLLASYEKGAGIQTRIENSNALIKSDFYKTNVDVVADIDIHGVLQRCS